MGIRSTSFFFSGLLVMGCSTGKLVTVEIPTEEGKANLIYMGKERPDHLVAEVRLNSANDTIMYTPMQKGKVHGTVVAFSDIGKRSQTIEYQQGIQSGLFRKYDNEGVLLIEGTLVEGKKKGVWTVWFDETQMSEQCPYENDMRNGTCTFWYIDGNIKAEETYERGKLTLRKEF